MKIEWEGKEITIEGGGTTSIECVGSLIGIETTGKVTLSGNVDCDYTDLEPMVEPPKEVWSDWLYITHLNRGAFRGYTPSSKVGLAISVLELQGVRQVKIRDSSQMRIKMIVCGGDIYKIADTIRNHKPCGVSLVGSVAIDIPTEYGCVSTIRFNYSH